MKRTLAVIALLASTVSVHAESAIMPFAYRSFCSTQPVQCQSQGPSTISLTDDMMQALKSVNRSVNRSIRPVVERFDEYSLNPRSGDCEDYAITKRAKLVAMGFPSASLRLATSLTETGESHMVLIVRTSDGSLVLDNRRSSIVPMGQAGYSWRAIEGRGGWNHL